MKRLHVWLMRELSLSDLISYLPSILILNLLLSIVGLGIARLMFSFESLSANGNAVTESLRQYSIFKQILMVGVLVPLVEEGMFRFLPLAAVFGIASLVGIRTSTYAFYGITSTVLVSSASFGYAHGGLGNVLIQGAVGVMFAVIFIRCSAYGKGFFALLKGLVGSTLAHGAFNTMLTLMLLVSHIR